MREIQQLAAFNNRLFSFAFSMTAFMILWFVGALVFWQAAKSTGGQEWTYFESLYFAFIAQLTIGYGDFSPQTNSAKPAFVFWALIALPTLTVLIGAIGDVVSSFVNWYTVWLGNHTRDLWRWVRVFRKKNDTPKDKLREAKQMTKESESTLSDLQMSIAEETYKPLVMLKAAQTILGHLDEEKPRTYSYQEWALLLKLLGEDETDEIGHRRVGQQVPDGVEVMTPVMTRTGTGDSQICWSWIGQESPLMSLQEGWVGRISVPEVVY